MVYPTESRVNIPKDKEELGAESLKQMTGEIEGQINPIRSKRRKLSIEAAPSVIRGVAGRKFCEFPAWLGNAVLSAIQQLKEASRTNVGNRREYSNPFKSD